MVTAAHPFSFGLAKKTRRNSEKLDPFFAILIPSIVRALIIGMYFAPTLVAGWRNHRNTGAIFVLNFLLGWWLIGWAAALIWALTDRRVPNCNA
jgi:hypothetical protein